MKHLKFFGDSDLRYRTFDDILENVPVEVRAHIEDLKQLRERPDHHPEENAYEHVKIVTNRLITTGDPDLVMTGIFHDIGKLVKNVGHPKTGYPSAPDHPKYAGDMVDKHRDWIWWFGANPDNVKWLVENHMRIKRLSDMRKNTASRKEIESSPLYDKLVIFTKADEMLADFSA